MLMPQSQTKTPILGSCPFDIDLRDLLDHVVDGDLRFAIHMRAGLGRRSDASATVVGMSLGAANAPVTKMPLRLVLQRGVYTGLAESVLVQFDAERLDDVLASAGGSKPTESTTRSNSSAAIVAAPMLYRRVRFLVSGSSSTDGDPGAAVHLDAVLLLGPGAVVLELLAEGPDVHEEDGRLQSRGVLTGDDGLLHGVHAADARSSRGCLPSRPWNRRTG